MNSNNLSRKGQLLIILLITVLLFAFSKTFWSQALISEVYTLVAFFVVLLLYLYFFESKRFYLFMFVFGLGVSHHHIILLTSPLVLVYIIKIWKNIQYPENSISGIKKFIYGILFFILGISVFIYLPLRSLSNPAVDWGNPENLKNFIRHISRTQYSFKTPYGYSISLFLLQVKSYLDVFLEQFGRITPLVIIFGLFGLFRVFRNKKLFFTTIYIFLAMSLGFILIINFNVTVKNLYVVDVFYISSYLIFIVWSFFGLIYVYEKTKLLTNIVLILVVILLIHVFFVNYKSNNLSKNYFLVEYGRNIMRTPDKNSVVFVSGDNPMFSCVYLQEVEKIRTDLTIYDDYGSIFKNIYGDDFLFLPVLEHNKIMNEAQLKVINTANNPIYCTLGSNPYKFTQFEKIPVQLLYRIIKDNDKKYFVPDFFESSTFEKTINNLGQSPKRGQSQLLKFPCLKINSKIIENDYLIKEILARYYFAKAEYYRYKGNKSKSYEYYMKALDYAKGVEWLEIHIADVLFSFDSKDDALNSYIRVIENNQYNADTHNNLGVLLLEKGEIDKAKIEFEKTLEINQYHAAAINNLGSVYLKKGDKRKSYELYKKAVAIDDNQVDAHSNLGSLYAEDGEYDKAIIEFKKSLELKKDDKKALNNLGVVYYIRGMDNEALKYLEKAVEVDYNNADVHNNLGSIYAKMNKIDLAYREWKRALEIDPNHKDAKENLKKINRK